MLKTHIFWQDNSVPPEWQGVTFRVRMLNQVGAGAVLCTHPGHPRGCRAGCCRLEVMQVKAPTLRLHVHNSHGHLPRAQGSPLILGVKSELELSLLPALLCSRLQSSYTHEQWWKQPWLLSCIREFGATLPSLTAWADQKRSICWHSLRHNDATFKAFPQKYLTCLNTSAASSSQQSTAQWGNS